MNSTLPPIREGEAGEEAARFERERDARSRFPSIRRRAHGTAIALLAFFIFCLLAMLRHWSPFGLDPRLWSVGIFAVIAALLVVPRVLWRCPACNQRLGETWNPLQCERCGVSLREEGVAVRAITASRTEEELVAVRDAYAKLRRRQFLATTPLLLFVVLELLRAVGVDFSSFIDFQNRWTLPALVAVGVAMTSFSLWNWRCPACRSYLGKTRDARHCRRCGVELWR
jgi:hypothetical protein